MVSLGALGIFGGTFRDIKSIMLHYW